MIGGTVAFSTASSAFLLETTDANANNSIRSPSSSSSVRKSLSFNPRISCSASSSSSSSSSSGNRDYGIPKLKTFSRSMFERALKERSLIEKTEQELADYCSVLEVEDSYDCWQAYLDLRYLETEAPKKDVESIIVLSAEGGLKSLIRLVPGFASIYKEKNEGAKGEKKEGARAPKKEVEVVNGETRIPRPIPDGIPRPLEEIEEEEKDRMPDSPFTRLLRVMGKYPAWYTPPPDHE